jgi:putative transposase
VLSAISRAGRALQWDRERGSRFRSTTNTVMKPQRNMKEAENPQSKSTDSAGRGSPALQLQQRKHLHRLDWVFEGNRAPLFFITICTEQRAPVLAAAGIYEILVNTWKDALEIHGWRVGRYVVMPDHVHFFAAPDTEQAKDLSGFVGKWKQRTRQQIREQHLPDFSWQKEFFDHLLRSAESYSEKWEYVRLNPQRAGLVDRAEDWPYQGEICSLDW